MASVTNIVDLVFKVTDQASAGTRAIESSMKSVTTASNFARTAIASVGAAFGIAGVVGTVKKIVDLSNDWEKTTIRIAGGLQSMGIGTDFETTLRTTEFLMNRIQENAAKLPGEAEDYIQVLAANVPQIAASGVTNLIDMVDFVSDYTAFTTSRTIDSQQAALDLSMMLSGRAGMQVRTFANELRNLVDVQYSTSEAFNALSAQKRMLVIAEALKKNSAAQAKAADTYDAKLGEVLGKLKLMVHYSSKPLFEQLKTVMDGISQFISENQEGISQLVGMLGYGMLAAINMIRPALGWLLDHLQLIAKAAAVFAGVWTGSQIASILAGMGKVIAFTRELVQMTKAFGIMEVVVMLLKDLAGKGGIAGLITGGIKLVVIEESIRHMVGVVSDAFGELEKSTGKFRLDMDTAFAPVMDMPKSTKVPMLDWQLPDYKKLLKEMKGPPKVDVNFNNARFDIKQNFAEGYDPDRIAIAFVDQIGAATAFRGASGFSGMTGSGA